VRRGSAVKGNEVEDGGLVSGEATCAIIIVYFDMHTPAAVAFRAVFYTNFCSTPLKILRVPLNG